MADETRKDYVAEAYETFIKNAADLDPSAPVAAIQAYFDKNASDDLKARVKAEGKTAKGCWEFIEAVARKALHGHSGHIDPAAVYAIAMHWFEDVPKDWDGTPASAEAPARQAKTKKAKPKKPAETPSEIRKEKAKAKAKAAKPKPKPKPKRPKFQQGFFFDVLEVPETENAETETQSAETETQSAETETEKPETGTEKPETGTEKPETGTEADNAD